MARHTDEVLTTRIECVDLAAEFAFFRGLDGFRVHSVSPADDPRRIVLHAAVGAAVELVRSDAERPVVLTIESDRADRRETMSPGGTLVTIVPFVAASDDRVGSAMELPANSPTLTIVERTDGRFGIGRAGMEYRDLLPDRWGGRFVASHIRIADGGEVDDWVHFHRIRFQMIYVAAGWVDVVYEDQGEPFRMSAGDCVLQPPQIRHRVLRSSPGLEVIEIGCPAEHDTLADHDLTLPNSRVDRERDFAGQRFVRHVATAATTEPWIDPGMRVRDTGIGAATEQLAGAVVIGGTVDADQPGPALIHHGEFALVVGLHGEAMLDVDDRRVTLAPGASMAIPAGTTWRWSSWTARHEALLVTLPADAVEPA